MCYKMHPGFPGHSKVIAPPVLAVAATKSASDEN